MAVCPGQRLAGLVVSDPQTQAGWSQGASVWGVSLLCFKTSKPSQARSSLDIKSNYRMKSAGGSHCSAFCKPPSRETAAFGPLPGGGHPEGRCSRQLCGPCGPGAHGQGPGTVPKVPSPTPHPLRGTVRDPHCPWEGGAASLGRADRPRVEVQVATRCPRNYSLTPPPVWPWPRRTRETAMLPALGAGFQRSGFACGQQIVVFSTLRKFVGRKCPPRPNRARVTPAHHSEPHAHLPEAPLSLPVQQQRCARPPRVGRCTLRAVPRGHGVSPRECEVRKAVRFGSEQETRPRPGSWCPPGRLCSGHQGTGWCAWGAGLAAAGVALGCPVWDLGPFWTMVVPDTRGPPPPRPRPQPTARRATSEPTSRTWRRRRRRRTGAGRKRSGPRGRPRRGGSRRRPGDGWT